MGIYITLLHLELYEFGTETRPAQPAEGSKPKPVQAQQATSGDPRRSIWCLENNNLSTIAGCHTGNIPHIKSQATASHLDIHWILAVILRRLLCVIVDIALGR